MFRPELGGFAEALLMRRRGRVRSGGWLWFGRLSVLAFCLPLLLFACTALRLGLVLRLSSLLCFHLSLTIEFLFPSLFHLNMLLQSFTSGLLSGAGLCFLFLAGGLCLRLALLFGLEPGLAFDFGFTGLLSLSLHFALGFGFAKLRGF